MEDIIKFEPVPYNERVTECPCPFVADYMKQKIKELQQNYHRQDETKDDEEKIPEKFRDLEGWMDNHEVATAFNLSKKLLQDMRSDHKIPYSKFGSKIVYYREDITMMLKRNYREEKR